MSLDVYLYAAQPVKCPAGSGIFVRDGGRTVEITREEWDAKFPDREPVVAVRDDDEPRRDVFQSNITHNLVAMADEAGVYKHCWRPDEIGIRHARQLIEPLERAITEMKADPQRFKAHDAKNGWGTYEHLVPWLEGYLAACKEYPDAEVVASG